MICAITRKIMAYFGDYVRGYPIHIMEELCELLLSKWTHFNVINFGSMQSLSIYTGDEIKSFISMIDDIILWIQNTFVPTKETIALGKALAIWKELCSFLRRSTIYSKDDDDGTKIIKIRYYEIAMKKIKRLVKEFYAYGTDTFLSTHSIGYAETFYCHVIRYYMNDIIIDTWEKYGLGVGIFNMHGFERRNKESKFTLGHHTNNKGNVIIQNLVKLFGSFYNTTV
jgi:hypothetical protein